MRCLEDGITDALKDANSTVPLYIAPGASRFRCRDDQVVGLVVEFYEACVYLVERF